MPNKWTEQHSLCGWLLNVYLNVYGSQNREWRLSVPRGVQQFILSPCVSQVRFSGTTCSLIPQRIKMSPRSFCQLVPCGSFPFVPAQLLQFEEKPSAFVSVRCLWAQVCPGHVWLLCHTVALSSKSSVQSGLSKQKDGAEEANQPSAPRSPTEALKHSFWLPLLFPDTRLLSGLFDSYRSRKLTFMSFMLNWAQLKNGV